MVDPVLINIPVGQWVKVATDVTSGMIYPIDTDPVYSQTYRDTGGAAPANGDLSEAVNLPLEGARIRSGAGVDVYIAVTSNDAGSVRVDL